MKVGKSPLKFVLTILANHANKNGECWVTYKKLCQESELCRRTVIGVIKELQKMGLIIKKKRVHPNKRSRANLYKILPNFIPKVINKGASHAPWEGAPHAPQEGAPHAPL